MIAANPKPKVIYIAGAGRSGSTILNLLLGTARQCFSTGEVTRLPYHFYKDILPLPKREGFDICDCGKTVKDCAFWRGIDKSVDLMKMLPFVSSPQEKALVLLSIYFPFFERFLKRYDDHKLYQELICRAKQFEGQGVEYIVDSSKGLRRLLYLSINKNIDLRVIHLIRDIRGVVNSREKQREYWLKSCGEWILLNLFLKRLISNRIEKTKYISVAYDLFAQNPERYLEKIGKKFGVDLDPSYIMKQVRRQQFHNFSGNRLSWSKVKGIKCDRSWETKMPKWKQAMLNFISYIPNRLLIYK